MWQVGIFFVVILGQETPFVSLCCPLFDAWIKASGRARAKSKSVWIPKPVLNANSPLCGVYRIVT